jgi:hypothetical protein
MWLSQNTRSTLAYALMRFCRYATIALVIGALSSCGLAPESTLTLSRESRLPRWMTVNGTNNKNLTTKVEYFVWPWKTYAQITLMDRQGEIIARVDSDSLVSEPQKAVGTLARGAYPSYVVMAVNGVVDIFEHRKADNILNMCDDAAVWATLAPGIKMPPSAGAVQ